MSKNINTILPSADIRNEGDIVATLTTAGTWYTLTDANFTYYLLPQLFTFNVATGRLTYTGTKVAQSISFFGDAVFKVNSVSTVSFGLFVNGVLIPNMESTVDVSFANKSLAVGINAIGDISPSDYLEIKAKSTGSGDVLTVTNIHTTYLGIFRS